jgi:uncharacterized protein
VVPGPRRGRHRPRGGDDVVRWPELRLRTAKLDCVLTGRYEPYESSNSIQLGSVGPSLKEHAYDSPGLVRFRYEDHIYTLQVLRSRGTLNAIFTDGTSGATTYGAGRSLMISEVDENG